MKKILQVGLSSNPGGIETFIKNYYNFIDRTSLQFDFADIYGEGIAFQEEFQLHGAKIYKLPYFKQHPIKFLRKFRHILRTNNYYAIHINMLSAANILPIVGCIGIKNTRIIVHSHNSGLPLGIVRKILNRINLFFLRRDKKIIKWACGIAAGKWMWGKCFLSENVIPNAVDVERFQHATPNFQKLYSLNIDKDAKIIGYIGRLVEQKNVLFIPEIAKEIIKIDPKIHFIVIGDGELKTELQRRIYKLNVGSNVHLVGIQKDIPNWYKTMNVFILPSLFEGVPVVGIEAQAAGINSIFSDRISKEVGLTKKARFLPINKGAKLWADEIINELKNKTVNVNDFPNEYNIKYAALNLQKKYDRL